METSDFFLLWDRYMALAAYVAFGFAILLFLYHEFKIFQIKDYKEKYDYVNLHEIRYFWYSVIAIIIAVALYANTIATGRIRSSEGMGMTWFYVRLFVTACFAVIAYIVFFSMVRIYYPRSVEKRLHKLRNTPRTSPEGNKMRKLSEEEEDSHLEASQIAEESSAIHAVDYDVWIDEKTGSKKIEKYFSYQHTEECPECGYFTMKITQEEVEQAPSTSASGLLLKHYRCSYCNHREQRQVVLSKLSDNIS